MAVSRNKTLGTRLGCLHFAAYDDFVDCNDGGGVSNGNGSENDGDVNDNFNYDGNGDDDNSDNNTVMMMVMTMMKVQRLLLMMKSNVQIFHFIPALRFHVMNSTASFWLYNAKNYYITRNYYILY